MVSKRKVVSARFDEEFFDKVFEPNRKKMEKSLGVKVSQQKFTRMIKGFKFNVNLKKLMNNGKLKIRKK